MTRSLKLEAGREDRGDAGFTRRAVIASAGLAATGAAAFAVSLRRREDVRPLGFERIVPHAFGSWSAIEDATPVLPDESEKLSVDRAYEESVSRVYGRSDGAIVMLVVAHGRPNSGMLAIHRPATCYTAQGFTVTSPRNVPLPPPFASVSSDELFAVRGERQEPIVSWVTIAGQQTGFGITQKFAQLRAAWNGAPSDAVFVRASTLGPDAPASYDLLSRFLVQLLEHLTASQRRLVAGIA